MWDKASYLRQSGARAVSTESTHSKNGQLRYCTVSTKTIAISHVWIHGMGGRPEDGFNACLHRRFSRLTRQLGCDLYWCDATCIPSQTDLRREAINNINSVFASCEVTLVCDRDLMSIDVSGCDFVTDKPDERTVVVSEQLLVALLVCDWNVRAWTFLECVKGRRNLQLLCKDNILVSPIDVLRIVHGFGSIEISGLALTSPHLLPPRAPTVDEMHYLHLHPGDSIISMSLAGSLLSYRPARRQDDEILIWSLLIKDSHEAYREPKSFWQSRQGTTIDTNFLMSSAPRLTVKGLNWAPITPNASRHAGLHSSQPFYRAFSNPNVATADITTEGLEGYWMCFVFPLKLNTVIPESFRPWLPSLLLNFTEAKWRATFDRSFPEAFVAECQKVEANFLKDYKFGMFIQPMKLAGSRNKPQDIAWASRSSETKQDRLKFARSPYANEFDEAQLAAQYMGPIKGILIAVLGSNGDFYQDANDENPTTYSPRTTWPKWTWRGVYEWPSDVYFPALRKRKIVIV